jgi:hypothetical protein
VPYPSRNREKNQKYKKSKSYTKRIVVLSFCKHETRITCQYDLELLLFKPFDEKDCSGGEWG